MKNFTDFLKSLKGDTLFLCHHNADVDAISTSILLSRFLQRINDTACPKIGTVYSIHQLSKNIIDEKDVLIGPDLKKFQNLILVDSPTFNLFGELSEDIRNFKGRIGLVDHHAPHKEMLGITECALVMEDAVSASEVAYELIKHNEGKIGKDDARLVLLGIIVDTGGFAHAKNRTFDITSELLATGLDYGDIRQELASEEKDESRRIAIMKCAQRCKVTRTGGYIIATSNVSSYEGTAAKALTNLGADVAFVVAKRKRDVRLSGRARDAFIKSSGIHLGKDIMQHIGEQINGSGSGHAGAAGANGNSDMKEDEILEKCVEKLKEKLST